MLGLFLASLGLSTAVAGTAFLSPSGPVDARATHTAASLRFWVLYLALVGLIGIPLTLLQLAAPVPLAVAVGSAAVISRALSAFFHETSAEVGLGHLAGTEGRVLLPVGPSAGKVVVETMADRIELPARSLDGLLSRGCRVLVAFVEDGVARVIPLERSPP